MAIEPRWMGHSRRFYVWATACTLIRQADFAGLIFINEPEHSNSFVSLPSGPSPYGFVSCQPAKSLPSGQVDEQGASENSNGKLSIAWLSPEQHGMALFFDWSSSFIPAIVPMSDIIRANQNFKKETSAKIPESKIPELSRRGQVYDPGRSRCNRRECAAPLSSGVVSAVCRQRMLRADLRDRLVPIDAIGHRLNRSFAGSTAGDLYGRPMHRQRFTAARGPAGFATSFADIRLH